MTRPLFIPLKREHFEDFRDGTKPNMEELRPEGQRWNARTCAIGRPVVLSLGYGKAQRLSGRIVGYRTSTEPTRTPAWKDCYGDRAGLAACIRIELDDAAARCHHAHITPVARITRESGLKFLAGDFPVGTAFYTGQQLEEACRRAVQAVAAQAQPASPLKGWKLVPVDRSYDLRVKCIIAFNTANGDVDDKLEAVHRAMLSAGRAALSAMAEQKGGAA